MKVRLLYGWNGLRLFYLLIGLVIIAQSIWLGQWAGILLGTYFAAMGLFRFGCAAGTCSTGYYGKERPRGKAVDFKKAKRSSHELGG